VIGAITVTLNAQRSTFNAELSSEQTTIPIPEVRTLSVERSELSVERSAPRAAVFLSYASQDAEAARRVCEALRFAGVEVWFDQSELRGAVKDGDVTDFICVLSASA